MKSGGGLWSGSDAGEKQCQDILHFSSSGGAFEYDYWLVSLCVMIRIMVFGDNVQDIIESYKKSGRQMMLTVLVRVELEYWQGRTKPSQDFIADGRRHSTHLSISIKLNFLTKRTRSMACDLSNWWLLTGRLVVSTSKESSRISDLANR